MRNKKKMNITLKLIWNFLFIIWVIDPLVLFLLGIPRIAIGFFIIHTIILTFVFLAVCHEKRKADDAKV